MRSSRPLVSSVLSLRALKDDLDDSGVPSAPGETRSLLEGFEPSRSASKATMSSLLVRRLGFDAREKVRACTASRLRRTDG